MGTRVRTSLGQEALRINREQLARLGREVRAARRRRRLTQARLGGRIGMSQSAISRAERGLGGGLTLDAWQRIALALGMPMRIQLQRDPLEETADAGHLAMQELVLRLGRAAGYRGMVELPTRPEHPSRSIDVAILDDEHRRLVVVECWNSIGDVGTAARSSNRKVAEAEAIATQRWGSTAHEVGLVWVVRATLRNRELMRRYPAVFASRFPASSAAWVEVLVSGGALPATAGLVWARVDGSALFAWRR